MTQPAVRPLEVELVGRSVVLSCGGVCHLGVFWSARAGLLAGPLHTRTDVELRKSRQLIFSKKSRRDDEGRDCCRVNRAGRGVQGRHVQMEFRTRCSLKPDASSRCPSVLYWSNSRVKKPKTVCG